MDPNPPGPAPSVEQLAESFLARLRRGERPSISEYSQRYPELAEDIHEAFSALAFVERFAPAPEEFAPARACSPAVKQLGEFRILREVGRGGMGIVYEAVQESLGRHVALKVLSPQYGADDTCVARFHREAQIAARLHHTNLVPVFDVGESDGIHYYAMQFIRGLSLDRVLVELQRMRRPAATDELLAPASELSESLATGLWNGGWESADAEAPSESPRSEIDSSMLAAGQVAFTDVTGSRRHYYQSVARVGLQIADGLGYLHEQGLLHRDVKPANLLLDTRGVVWITDLGLVRDEEAVALTRTGDVMGTLRYLAPERLRGEALVSGDLYSLGLTLYELLTLRTAFAPRDRGELAHQIRSVDPPAPRRIAAEIPRDLETIVLKSTEKDPRRRYQRAADLAADLRSFLEDRPILARRVGPFERSWRWCRRNRAVAALVGSVAALLIVLAIGSSWAAWLFRAERTKATQRLAESLVAQAQASRWSGRPGQRFDSLQALTEAAQLVPFLGPDQEQRLRLRNEAIACLALTDVRLPGQLTKAPSGFRMLDFDGGLQHYAASDRQGQVRVCRVGDNVAKVQLPGAESLAQLAQFSPTGKYLAVRYHDPGPMLVRVWSLPDAALVLEAPGTGAFDFDAGDHFSMAQSDGSVQVFDLPEKTPGHRFKGGAVATSLRFHPHESWVAVSSNEDPVVRVVDWSTGRIVGRFRHPQAVHDVAWNSAGTLLACGCADYRVHVWNVETKDEQALLTGHQAEVTHVAFNHRGDLLASYAWDGTTRLWDPVKGREEVCLNGLFRQFSPDDRLLSFLGGDSATGFPEFGLWEIADRRAFREFREPATAIKGPNMAHLSADGRWLASTSHEGVRIWDVTAGREVAAIEAATSWSAQAMALFHPETHALLTSSEEGLCRWPLAKASAAGFELGAPERLLESVVTRRMAVDRDARRAAVVDGQVVRVMDLANGAEIARTGTHLGLSGVALSPDGRWVATGTWQGSGAKVWDATTGREARDLLPEGRSATVVFSPDGRWLVVGTQELFRFFEVGTWQLLRQTPGSNPYQAAFSADGGLMAVTHSRNAIQLLDPATMQVLACLESPRPEPLSWLSLSADGGQLAAASKSHVTQIWDLHLVRRQLAEMGLNWGPPPAKTPPER